MPKAPVKPFSTTIKDIEKRAKKYMSKKRIEYYDSLKAERLASIEYAKKLKENKAKKTNKA